MNRPTKGPFVPSDREPAPDRSNGAAPGDAWTGALRELRTMARRHEAPPTTLAAGERPAAARPEPTAAAVEEALAALQRLARRYGAAGNPAAPPTAESLADSPVATDGGENGPSAPEDEEPGFDEPSAGVRLLQRRRPGWTSLALILVSAAVLAVLLVGALSLSRQLFHGRATTIERSPDTAGHAMALPAPADRDAGMPGPERGTVAVVAAPTVAGAPDLRAIEAAMDACDLEAAKDPDALYFLIVPAVSPTRDYSLWAPRSVGDIGTSVILLRSKDAIEGLRNGSLAVYSGPYKFSIIDSATEATHNWPAATGVAKLTKADAATIAGFRIRFGFADFVGDTPSNFRFPRDKGVCYWVSALLRT